MKQIELPVNGTEYPLCFSLRVVKACGERFGGLDSLSSALTGGGNAIEALNNVVWLLAQMLDAGCRLAQANGVEADAPPDEDALLDVFGLDDLAELRQRLTLAMSAGNARTVEAKPGKNGETTQDQREP